MASAPWRQDSFRVPAPPPSEYRSPTPPPPPPPPPQTPPPPPPPLRGDARPRGSEAAAETWPTHQRQQQQRKQPSLQPPAPPPQEEQPRADNFNEARQQGVECYDGVKREGELKKRRMTRLEKQILEAEETAMAQPTHANNFDEQQGVKCYDGVKRQGELIRRCMTTQEKTRLGGSSDALPPADSQESSQASGGCAREGATPTTPQPPQAHIPVTHGENAREGGIKQPRLIPDKELKPPPPEPKGKRGLACQSHEALSIPHPQPRPMSFAPSAPHTVLPRDDAGPCQLSSLQAEPPGSPPEPHVAQTLQLAASAHAASGDVGLAPSESSGESKQHHGTSSKFSRRSTAPPKSLERHPQSTTTIWAMARADAKNARWSRKREPSRSQRTSKCSRRSTAPPKLLGRPQQPTHARGATRHLDDTQEYSQRLNACN